MKRLFLFLILTLFLTPVLGENVTLLWGVVNEDINGNPAVIVSYNVYRSDVSGSPYNLVGSAPQSPAPFFTEVVDLSTGDKFYVVSAIKNSGLEGGFSNEGTATALSPDTAPGTATVTITITVSP